LAQGMIRPRGYGPLCLTHSLLVAG
jgi:hypothetical protein